MCCSAIATSQGSCVATTSVRPGRKERMLASICLAGARSTRSDRSSLSRVSSDSQDDLAAHASMFHLLQGLAGLLEGIDVVDAHLQLSPITEPLTPPHT